MSYGCLSVTEGMACVHLYKREKGVGILLLWGWVSFFKKTSAFLNAQDA